MLYCHNYSIKMRDSNIITHYGSEEFCAMIASIPRISRSQTLSPGRGEKIDKGKISFLSLIFYRIE